jgi:WD40 repeat protein
MTSEGKWIVSGSRDKFVRLWNLKTKNKNYIITGYAGSVTSVTVTPDGKQIIIGSNNNDIKVWNLETRQELFPLIGHTDSINSVVVTPNGLRVLSTSNDNTLKVWDLESRRVIASFTGESALLCCAAAPDGVTIVAGEASGRVHFLRLEGV